MPSTPRKTANAPRKAAQTPKAPPADPLEALREKDTPPPTPPIVGPDPAASADDPEQTPPTPTVDLVTEESQAEARAEVIAAWHKDPTSVGFLHRGSNRCGCRYLAQVALDTVLPVQVNDAEPEASPDDAGE